MEAEHGKNYNSFHINTDERSRRTVQLSFASLNSASRSFISCEIPGHRTALRETFVYWSRLSYRLHHPSHKALGIKKWTNNLLLSNTRAPLHKTMVTIQLMVSRQTGKVYHSNTAPWPIKVKKSMIVTIVCRDIINCKVTIVLCNGAQSLYVPKLKASMYLQVSQRCF